MTNEIFEQFQFICEHCGNAINKRDTHCHACVRPVIQPVKKVRKEETQPSGKRTKKPNSKTNGVVDLIGDFLLASVIVFLVSVIGYRSFYSAPGDTAGNRISHLTPAYATTPRKNRFEEKTINRAMFGEDWPLTVDEVTVVCRGSRYPFVYHAGTYYPLTGAAQAYAKNFPYEGPYAPLEDIWARDTELAEMLAEAGAKNWHLVRISIRPVLDVGLKLCGI